ncbi:hypothetical protein GCM10009847_04020 [Leucobacter tardus]|uniref:CPBP family intramembrane glutamic endopeptidase n=1 Tax=Leucobacter tardus TaxID=501483 RepID=UPI001FBB60DD|nr:CPBP family intramembrane glutamic endopeptidase [Leucobacter tardus]
MTIPQPPESGQSPWPQEPQAAPDAAAPAAAPWPWVQRKRWQTVETEELEYHRLFRGVTGFRWWKPLVALVLAALYYFTLSLVFGIVMGPVLVLTSGVPFGDMTAFMENFERLLVLDTQEPLSLVFGLGSVILMIPSVWLALLSVGIRPLGRAWSVALRVRWGLVWKTAGLAIACLLVTNGLSIVVQMLFFDSPQEMAAEMPEIDLTAAMWSLLIVLLLVPFQAAAEELVFRGFFMQVIGSWLRSPWLAILLPTVAFALAHIYDIWGMLSVGVMGLIAAWLSWRTGGLEAAISIHVVNNLIAFGIMASGLSGSTAQESETGGSWVSILVQAAGLLLFLVLTMVIFRRGGYGRTRIDLIQVPALDPEPRIAPGPHPGHADGPAGEARP